jgi:transposase
MPKRINYQLSKTEQAVIQHAVKSDPRPEVRRRANVIRLLHLGKKPAEVAEVMAISVVSVYGWHERWRSAGLEGLADKPRSGRPPLATAAYCAQVEEVMATDPSQFGYTFTVWTVARLIAHLAQTTEITLSEDTFRSLLKEHDYVYRRPKHDLKPLQDKAAKQRALETLEMLKKRPQPARSNYSLWTKRPSPSCRSCVSAG